jgi:hypothetical protein
LAISTKGISSRSGSVNPNELTEEKLARIVTLAADSVSPYLRFTQFQYILLLGFNA